jgi:hypothetical protein
MAFNHATGLSNHIAVQGMRDLTSSRCGEYAKAARLCAGLMNREPPPRGTVPHESHPTEHLAAENNTQLS